MAKPKIEGEGVDEAPAAPVTADGEAVASAQPAVFTASAEDRERHTTKREQMRKLLAKQDKVRVRVSEDTYLNINGHPVRLKAGRVEVPALVAEVLEQAGRI